MVSHARLYALIVMAIIEGLVCSKLAAAVVEPGITLSTSDETIYLGDSIIIEVEAVGITEALDISPLFKGADLLRETTGTRIAVINERVVEVKLRRMEFLPRREGRLFFGPLSGVSIKGDVTSNTLMVDVQPPADTNWQPEPDDLQIMMTLTISNGSSKAPVFDSSKRAGAIAEPFVGQHLIAEMELRHRHPIADEQITLPDFTGFDVLEQFAERRTVLERPDDDSWRVTAWRYHLFAQRSGDIVIDKVQWKGTAIGSRTQRFNFDRSSDSIAFRVKPASSNQDWWLPASHVTLTDAWSKDPRELSAGDEIIRTITLSANDVLANHLPDVVPLESRALTTTPIRQTRSQALIGDQLTATAVFDFRMIAQSPIPVFLDTVRVPWYSPIDDADKEAIIPARRINVGLPDRADLLADIALNERWIDKLQLQLRGSNQLPWYVAVAVLSMLALWLWFKEFRYAITQRRKRRDGETEALFAEL